VHPSSLIRLCVFAPLREVINSLFIFFRLRFRFGLGRRCRGDFFFFRFCRVCLCFRLRLRGRRCGDFFFFRFCRVRFRFRFRLRGWRCRLRLSGLGRFAAHCRYGLFELLLDFRDLRPGRVGVLLRRFQRLLRLRVLGLGLVGLLLRCRQLFREPHL